MRFDSDLKIENCKIGMRSDTNEEKQRDGFKLSINGIELIRGTNKEYLERMKSAIDNYVELAVYRRTYTLHRTGGDTK